jgi:SAM-dependent methyltransferase
VKPTQDSDSAKGFQGDPQFAPIIRWAAAYHYRWLERNPAFFTLKNFWQEIDSVRNEPNLVFGYRDLPTKGGTIDWSSIAYDYHAYILSPFAPEMVIPDSSGTCRNLLVNFLLSLPGSDLEHTRLADFGCGPGNLLLHLPKCIRNVVGIDRNETVLEVASGKAVDLGIRFEAMLGDFRHLDFSEEFDIITSSNSILPEERSDVREALSVVRKSLNKTGKFAAIMPSFDTVLYLRNLWEIHYRQTISDERHIKRILRSFDETKKLNRDTLSYADDGRTAQCYHTPESIESDFKACGLKIMSPLKKVYYPWTLTKRFDYGYFPAAKEEIWDWFVVAERI